LRWYHPSINSDAYESLKSYGLHVIKNDSIRKQLGGIYENEWIQTLNARQDDYFANTIAPILTDLFESYEFGGEMKPVDYDELRKSKKYNHILKTMLAKREYQNRNYTLF